MLKKLEGQDAIIFKSWLDKNTDTVVDVDGRRYLVQEIQGPSVQEEVESDPELKRIILQAKQDITDGNVFTTDEILEAIERGEI